MMMEANNDDELLIEKNSARQKFGLPPISLDELLKLRSEEGAVRSAFEERLIKQQVSERSERALMKTSILAMSLAKWLRHYGCHQNIKLTFIPLNSFGSLHDFCSCFK